MKKSFFNHLRYHIGGVCLNTETGENFGLSSNNYFSVLSKKIKAKIILKPLSEITDEDNVLIGEILAQEPKSQFYISALVTEYLLLNRYDVFGLLDTDLAINEALCSSNGL